MRCVYICIFIYLIPLAGKSAFRVCVCILRHFRAQGLPWTGIGFLRNLMLGGGHYKSCMVLWQLVQAWSGIASCPTTPGKDESPVKQVQLGLLWGGFTI